MISHVCRARTYFMNNAHNAHDALELNFIIKFLACTSLQSNATVQHYPTTLNTISNLLYTLYTLIVFFLVLKITLGLIIVLIIRILRTERLLPYRLNSRKRDRAG
jgi:hypothetical protein